MSNSEKSATTKGATKSPAKGMSLTEVQAQVQKEADQGFRGIEIDSTPNENYTVAGVTKGAPTPETDAKAAEKVRIEQGTGLSAIEAAEREKRGEK